MATSINLKFYYEGRLVGDPYEIAPRLRWWSSTVRSAKKGIKYIPISWEDEESQVAKPNSVDIPLSTSPYRQDDHIWVECIVQSPTEEGMYVGARAGVSSISLKKICDSVTKKNSFAAKLNLRMPQLVRSGEPFLKGKLKVEIIDGKSLAFIKRWRFKEVGPYDLVPENTRRVLGIRDLNINSTLFPYSDMAERMGLQYEPAVPRIEGLHAPVWVSNLLVPGWAYWVDYSEYEPSELFMENIAKNALQRHKMKRAVFIDIVDGQFSRSDDYYDERFTTAAAITADTNVILSVSLFYKSDESYVLEESDSWFSAEEKIRKIAIESFNDALAMNGDDCEGLGGLDNRVTRILKRGMPHLKGSAQWNKNGGWTDPVLQRMQRIMYWYVSGGALGSVTSARVGGSKSSDKPLIIDSYEDVNSKLGFHIWQEGIPVTKFEEMINRASPSKRKMKIRTAVYPKWLSKIPHTVGEGTGAVYPLLKPIGEYYPGTKSTVLRTQAMKLSAMKDLKKNSRYLKMGQIQRIQKMLKNVPDARLSSFYRRTTTFSTDEFFLEGYPTAELIWTQMTPRESERQRSDEYDGEDDQWKWGVNMRDKLKDADSDDSLGLIVVPPFTTEEIAAVKSLLRQLPPLETPTLTVAGKEKIGKYASPFIGEFRRICDKYTRTRVQAEKSEYVNVIFRREEFFRGMLDKEKGITLRDGLLDDIDNMDSIYDVKTSLEVITNQVYNVRITLFMNVTSDV